MLYIYTDEDVECGSCELACPVEVIFCEDGVPGQWARFTTENASLFDPLGSPAGASKTGLLASATDYVASCVTSRQRHGARTRVLRRRRGRRPGSRRDGAASMTPCPGPRLRARPSCLPAARPVPPRGS
jgi:Fe-S-cluster-containing hydrogenase component 2